MLSTVPPFDAPVCHDHYMRESTISRAEAKKIYDRLGTGLDRTARYEARAREQALRLLSLEAGQRVLQVGVGTGGEHSVINSAIAPAGVAVGVDLSRGMLALTRQRVSTPLCEGDAGALPFATGSFDRLFSAYLLDLLPGSELPGVLAEFQRVLKPDGQIALVSLTEGVTPASRVFVAMWSVAFRIRPQALGGCRPIRLAALTAHAGFAIEHRSVVVQHNFPSEIVVAVARGYGVLGV